MYLKRMKVDLRLAFWDEDVLVHFFERMPQWFIATFIACLLTTTGSHSYKHQKHLGYLFSLLARWEKYGDSWRTSYFWNTLKCLSFCLVALNLEQQVIGTISILVWSTCCCCCCCCSNSLFFFVLENRMHRYRHRFWRLQIYSYFWQDHCG